MYDIYTTQRGGVVPMGRWPSEWGRDLYLVQTSEDEVINDWPGEVSRPEVLKYLAVEGLMWVVVVGVGFADHLLVYHVVQTGKYVKTRWL